MKKTCLAVLAMVALAATPNEADAKEWSLQDCIDYAITNNISLQKNSIQKLSALEDVKESKSMLLPSLGFSTSQNVTYRSWPETGRATVANGYVQSSVDKTYYNGMYGVNANWTVWNGNRNRNTVKMNKLIAQKAELDSATTANSIVEQIAQLYVQILYSTEAIKVNKESFETSKKNEERGKEMVAVGKMSKADLAQLTSQRAQDEYNVVQSESSMKEYKRQLKQLLQITSEDEFDVAMPTATDDMALQAIPALGGVYAKALSSRPEIAGAKIGVESSDLNIKIAKGMRLPTLGFTASAATNTTSMSDNKWGRQLKNNFDVGAGVSLTIPIFDNRSAKTAINKAKLQRQNYMLDLKDKQTALHAAIENYWLQANNNQNQFKAAKVSAESAQTSYDLLSEQFRLGLKNIVELMTGKDKLLAAKQSELQSKYLAILNINMLKFYENGKMK